MTHVDRLTLAEVTAVPDWHPEHATFEPFPVYAWVVRHPEAVVLVDTGIGTGSAVVDDWYHPVRVPLRDALAGVGLDVTDIDMVVLSHLHFDHCGQQHEVPAPVWVQSAEWEAAKAPRYTVPEWAAVPADRLRLVDGDHQLLDGVRLMPTPGHTPGHQSVLVEGGGGRVVLGGQCAFRAGEVRSGDPGPTNLHDPSWSDAASASLARIRALGPATVYLSHDPELTPLP